LIKLLIADDHTLVRKGLKQILLESKGIERVDEAATAKETINKVSQKDYDLVVLDISLPDRSGIDVLKQLKSLKPKLPVLILSMYPEEQYAFRSLRAGAAGYLTKVSAPDELITAIQRVASGGKYITLSLAEKLADELDSHMDKPPHEILSDREFQVMCMIASGSTVKEIASALDLSVKTISTHRSRMLKKMHMDNNSQITYYAFKHGLVD
jgi:DNA-binding NarL/FixJ family response regulator